MKIKPALFIFIAIIAFMFNCSKSDETYTVEIKDGVKHVHNNAPLWGDEPKIALEFVQKIGDLDTEDENYQLYKPSDIVRDASENLYVLDKGNYRIQKFDKHGKYLATIGRQGQGPSEFIEPMTLEIDAEGNLYVGDFSQKCILVLTNEGKEIRRIKPFDVTARIRVTNSRNIFTHTSGIKRLRAEDIARDTRLICLHDNDGNLLKEFGELKDYGERDLTDRGNNIVMCLDSDDNLYIAFHNQNRIEKYSPEGEIIFRADRPLNYKLTHEMETITFPPDLEGRIRTRTRPKFTMVTFSIGIDHKDRLWILSYRKQQEEGDSFNEFLEFEVFNLEGILLFKVPFPNKYVDSMRMFKDRLYIIDPFTEMCVYEYKILEK